MMRLNTLLLVLSTLASTSLLAQQQPKMPAAAPTPSGPGTATPQPYPATTPQHLPASKANNPPLLKPATPAQPSQQRRDKDLPLLQEQRERNAKSLSKPDE
jgi:hypothetical protein